MGINRHAHIKLESVDKWHYLGDILAPKDHWKKILHDEAGERDTGLQSLTVRKSKRPDGLLGYVQVKVEPSSRVPNGVFVEVNDHFEISAKDPLGCEEILEILENNYSMSMPRSDEIIDSLIDIAK